VALLRSAAGALAIAALLPAMPAYADCQPDPAVSGQTVICQGNDPNGFAANPGVDALIVRVGPNATVHDNGVAAISVNDDNVVRNRGTIDAHATTIGILAGDNNLIINTGEIKTGAIGTGIFVGDNNIVRNRGDITVGGGGTAIFGVNANTITNSSTGTINLGAGGIGIEAFGSGFDFIVNNGTITGAASTTGIASFGFGSTIINNGTITLGKANPSPSVGVLINAATNFTNNRTIQVGNGGEGLQASGPFNTITNNGTIQVGNDGQGFEIIGPFNTITNNGTIQIGNGGEGVQASGQFTTITNNLTIQVGNGGAGLQSSGEFSTITNNGMIQVGNGGAGIQTGSDLNTITNNGAIQVGNGGAGIEALGPFTTITNNGTITTGKNGVGILAGVLGGDNNLIINNVTGNITASGLLGDAIVVQNGGSVFNAGTIANTTPGGVAIDFCGCSSGYTLTVAPTSVITGLVTATGSDTFQLGGTGNGTFALNSFGPTKQYEGFGVFNVVSGFWTVDKVFGQNDAWNVLGGTLSGTGTLKDLNVDAGGTLQPGIAPGTALKVSGNLAFQTGAFYVATLNATTSALANVSGTATLAGNVEANIQGGLSNKTYTILHSGGLGGTTFDGFISTMPGLSGTLTYTPTDVLLAFNANLGLGGNLNINQQNVANALNNFFNSGGALPAGFLPVFNLAGGDLQNALTQLSGEANVDGQAVTFQQMTQFLSLMLDPFVAGRNGIGGGSGALGFAPEQEANFPSDIALAYDAILKAPPKPATLDQRWTAWGTAYGGNDKTNGDPAVGSNTFTANTFGFAAGMDYHPVPDTILGFALAGGGTNWTLAQALGSGRSDAFQAGVYGTKYFGPAYVAASLAVANNWMTTNRTALGDQLTASFNALSVGGRVEAGYRYAVQPAIGVTPYGALQAQSFHTPSYTETDLTGGGLGLTYAAMNATDTRSELGARFDGLTTLNGLPLILRGRLAWAHDWVSDPALSAVFQALSGASFVVNGAPLPANSALASAGAELKLNPHLSLLGKFDGEFANGSQTYAGTGTLRYTW
jgi:uncharacterized protein with beta-barrel porin domain